MENKYHKLTEPEALTQPRCGCGRDIRYMSLNGDGSCNKRKRCPTYFELEAQLATAQKLIGAYQMREASEKKLTATISILELEYAKQIS